MSVFYHSGNLGCFTAINVSEFGIIANCLVCEMLQIIVKFNLNTNKIFSAMFAGGYHDKFERSSVDTSCCQSCVWTLQPEEDDRTEHPAAGSTAVQIRSSVADSG